MSSNHIVKSYDKDLNYLNHQITDMGQLVISQLKAAIQAVMNRDIVIATAVIEKDPMVDAFENEIDTVAVRTIALRQPVAGDLRSVIAALKISSHLERIADYAANISRRAISLSDVTKFPPMSPVPRMALVAEGMINDVLNAYTTRDDDKALAVWQRDAELDDMYVSFLRELLTYMMEDPRNIGPCTQLLFVAKNIERIGDHATNIAEMVHYMVSGLPFKEPRPIGNRNA
jgi:phosphate transport system protein